MEQTKRTPRKAEQSLRSTAFMEYAIEHHRGAVIRLALALTREPADAQDIAQDVFIKLLRSQKEFRNDDHLRAWLLRTTHDTCVDLYRQAWRRRVEPCADMSTVADRAVLDPDIDAVIKHPIWIAMENLPDKLRAALHLFYIEGYPIDEAAKIMGCTTQAAKTRLHRGRKQLAVELDRMKGLGVRKDKQAISTQREASS